MYQELCFHIAEYLNKQPSACPLQYWPLPHTVCSRKIQCIEHTTSIIITVQDGKPARDLLEEAGCAIYEHVGSLTTTGWRKAREKGWMWPFIIWSPQKPSYPACMLSGDCRKEGMDHGCLAPYTLPLCTRYFSKNLHFIAISYSL